MIVLEFSITFVLVANQKNAIHLHSLHRPIVDKFEIFKVKMMESPHVLKVTASMEEPTGQAMDASNFEINGIYEGDKRLFLFPVDQEFLRFYDINMLYGSDMPEDYNPADSAEFFILNETAAKMIADQPESIIGRKLFLHFGYEGFIWPGPIIGVVEDFHLSGLDYEITPMVIFPKYTWLYCFSILPEGGPEPVIEHLTAVWEELFPEYRLEYYFSSSLIDSLYESELIQIKDHSGDITGAVLLFLACLAIFSHFYPGIAISDRKVDEKF